MLVEGQPEEKLQEVAMERDHMPSECGETKAGGRGRG